MFLLCGFSVPLWFNREGGNSKLNTQNSVLTGYYRRQGGPVNNLAKLLIAVALPLAVVGLVLGILALKSEDRSTAVIGIVLSSLGLLMGLAGLLYFVVMMVADQIVVWKAISQLVRETVATIPSSKL